MNESQNIKTKKHGTLRDTYIVYFILISCIPILALGSLSLITITNSHKKNISELEHQTLLTASKETADFFETIISTLSTNFDTLEESTVQDTKYSWQETYAEKFLKDNKAIIEVSFVNPQGKETVKKSKFDTNPQLLYLAESPLFKRALSGETAISDVHRTLQGETVTIAVPSSINGSIFNVVIAEIDISPLLVALDNLHVGDTGYVLLFDSTGELISANDNQVNTINFSTWSIVRDTLVGKTSNGLSPSDRYISLLSSIPVVSSSILTPTIRWPIIVEWPIVESDSIIESFRYKILGSIFFSVILVLCIAPFLANRLVLPIRKLQEATEEVKQGNFDKKVEITTNNELEDLGDSFNIMATGLKRLEELKNEFVYVAAHELRAPVTAIKGYMELIMDGTAGKLSPEMEHLLLPVKKSNDRLVNLVNDLLKVARSDAGKLEIEVTPTDIRPDITAIIEEIKPLALKRNISISYSPQENLPLVSINSGSFKEIIMNFASNAIKYGNDNGTLTISHEVQDGIVTTILADNGRGISEEDQKHLFEKFFRAEDVKKTEIEGTGLGLFITKELIEKMGGSITVKSALGQGTRFSITFKQAEV